MATRVYTLARELKFDAKLLMELAASKGMNVKSHMSNVTDAQERTLRELVAERKAA
ncbi:MAG: translation initiation factor IF-2 N-terminal domain-containing protein, partial [Planctomycetota bacterium]